MEVMLPGEHGSISSSTALPPDITLYRSVTVSLPDLSSLCVQSPASFFSFAKHICPAVSFGLGFSACAADCGRFKEAPASRHKAIAQIKYLFISGTLSQARHAASVMLPGEMTSEVTMML